LDLALIETEFAGPPLVLADEIVHVSRVFVSGGAETVPMACARVFYFVTDRY